MPVEKRPIFDQRDIFINYPFEEVMYRWDHLRKKIYVRFYGKDESSIAIPHENRLFNDALLYGDEITFNQYQKGVERG